MYSLRVEVRKKTTLTYEELYDEPYAINKLFIAFQPVYGEVFVTNINVGFGLEATYYLKDKLDFKVHARKAYARQLDFEREAAHTNANLDNEPNIYNYFEVGATYHIVDKEEDTETKIVLYSTRYKPKRWASRVPDHSIVPSKVRKIYGARLGGFAFDSSTDLARIIEDQGVAVPNASGMDITSMTTANIFGNVEAQGIYIGGSMALIKNFAIKPDRGFGVLVNDLIFTVFADVMYAPSINMDDIFYQGAEFSTQAVDLQKLGFRIGMDGKFNREFSWAYGAEIGSRPSVKRPYCLCCDQSEFSCLWH